MLEGVSLVFRWVPESCIVYRRDGEVLSDACDPCWYAFLPGMVVGYNERDLGGSVGPP